MTASSNISLVQTDEPLRVLAAENEFYIGTAVNSSKMEVDKDYVNTVNDEFNMVTVENDMKFPVIHPQRDVYDFTKADLIVDNAIKNNQLVRGHTLVWGNNIPDWVTKGNYSNYELRIILKNHIQTVVNHYKGKVYAWDVVNEAYNEDGTMKDTFWLRTIGEDYIKLAFQWAHEADPNVKLFYNDYEIDRPNLKSNAIYNLAKEMKAQNIPIDGIGYQMHITTERKISAKKFNENVNRFGELGIKTHVTELDIGIKAGTSVESGLKKQANMYSNILQMCLNNNNCTALILWGFTDKYTWRDKSELPLVYSDSYRPKQSYYYLLDTFIKHP